MRFLLAGAAITGAAVLIGWLAGPRQAMAFGFFELWALQLLWRVAARTPQSS